MNKEIIEQARQEREIASEESHRLARIADTTGNSEDSENFFEALERSVKATKKYQFLVEII